MQTVTDAAGIRAAIRGWRASGHNVGFVPTLGNLHAGHYSLLKLARARCDRVVASVFVNPTQFAAGEDFERYPRTLAQDQAGLAEAGCDILFAPEVSTIYPFGPAASVSIHVPVITDTLEGAHRPGHFDGVATVVAKLFSLVQPDLAVFGQKDFQQLKVIERMVADLSLSVKVMSAPTLRDEDGLAMSSRNQYLSPEERPVAAEISRTLAWMREAMGAGTEREKVEAGATHRLAAAGFEVDYAVVRDRELEVPAGEHGPRVALIAARLGRTRLIDNLEFEARSGSAAFPAGLNRR